ncbi:MAG: BspA family leucine-rich repeat surface protein, partial [Rhodobacteraceae bacterium]|nr:BspA family leucine-rich repeat surface protein [Paracoccaceae bacterium]
HMFRRCNSFNQSLSGWDVSSVTTAGDFMRDASGLSTTNYDSTLGGWSSQSVQNGVNIHFGGSQYSTATGLAYRNALVASGWTITDGGAV